MKQRVITYVALFAMIVALTGVASAFDIVFLKPDGTKVNPVLMQNGSSFNLDISLENLRPQDLGITSDLIKQYNGCTNDLHLANINCDVTDFDLALLKDTLNVTSVPSTIQSNTIFVSMHAPISRKPGTEYSFFVSTGPFADPPEPATVSLTIRILGANITGMKFNDLNGDGIKGTTEPGLAGWTINLKNETGDIIATTQTDANGNYKFTNQRGNFSVEEVNQSGWVQTSPANKIYNITVDAQDVSDLNFGNFQMGRISGLKFNDLNRNRVQNAGELGLAGWTIHLDGTDTITGEAVHQTRVTDSNGNFEFTNLTNGTYILSEELQSGWLQTAPASGNIIVDIRSGTDSTGNLFGNFQILVGGITGLKFNDLNGNHALNAGEPGLAGWTIHLDGTNSITGAAVHLTNVTDSNGVFSFVNVTQGTYTLTEELKAGWLQTSPASGSIVVTIDSTGVSTGNNFGNFKLGEVSGMKWNDSDGDGLKDTGEDPLADWSINIKGTDTITGQPVDITKQTDANGNYVFSDLTAGTYVIRETQKAGWKQTAPSTVTHTVTLTSGGVISNLNFGNMMIPLPPPRVPVPVTSTTGLIVMVGLMMVTAIPVLRRKAK